MAYGPPAIGSKRGSKEEAKRKLRERLEANSHKSQDEAKSRLKNAWRKRERAEGKQRGSGEDGKERKEKKRLGRNTRSQGHANDRHVPQMVAQKLNASGGFLQLMSQHLSSNILQLASTSIYQQGSASSLGLSFPHAAARSSMYVHMYLHITQSQSRMQLQLASDAPIDFRAPRIAPAVASCQIRTCTEYTSVVFSVLYRALRGHMYGDLRCIQVCTLLHA